MENEGLVQTIRLSMQRALLGQIYPSIRAVAYELDGPEKLRVVYYLDRNHNDLDYESISDVCAEILSDIDFKSIEEICEYTIKPFSELKPYNFVYLRKE